MSSAARNCRTLCCVAPFLWRHGHHLGRQQIVAKIHSLVYLDSFVPENGKSLFDYLRAEQSGQMRDDWPPESGRDRIAFPTHNAHEGPEARN